MTNSNIQLVCLKNVFDRRQKEVKKVNYTGQTVQDIVFDNLPPDLDFTVNLNGGEILRENWDKTYLKPGDELMALPYLAGGGGGGKSFIQIALMIVIMIYAPGLAAGLVGGLTGATMSVAAANAALMAGSMSGIMYGVALGGIMMAGGMLMNALAPKPSSPSLPASAEAVTSQSFGFQPQTLQKQDTAIPIFYGRSQARGNIISVYSQLNETNDKQILNLLLSLGEGPMVGPVKYDGTEQDEQDPSVFPEDFFSGYKIKINDQNIENFDDVSYIIKKGYIDQTSIDYFKDTKIEQLVAVVIKYEDSHVYTTNSNDFDDIIIDILFSNGIFYATDQGGFSDHSIGVLIEVAIAGTNDWQTVFDDKITDNRNCSLRYSYTTKDNVNIVNGNYYDVRVSKTTTEIEANSQRYGDGLTFHNIKEVINDPFEYPNTALVGIRALSSDQLSGAFSFSAEIKGKYIQTFKYDTDGVTILYGWEYSENPSYILADILCQPILNGTNPYIPEDGPGSVPDPFVVVDYRGMNINRLNISSFIELADFCDELILSDVDPSTYEKRCTFNGCFDTSSTVWQNALKVCEIARCNLIWSGIDISAVIDRPADPVQLFSIGNIVENSYKETFLPMVDRASNVSISYRDQNKNYERTIINIMDPALETSNPSNKVSLELFGIIRQSEAYRAGLYRLLQNKFIIRMIEFQVGIDAIASTIGDVINFQNDVSEFGLMGGRVVAYNNETRTLTLDRNIEEEIEDPSAEYNYEIIIRLKNDVLVTKEVKDINGNEIIVRSPYIYDPCPDDVYSFGKQNLSTKKFRILTLQRSQNLNIKMICVEYDERIYNLTDSGDYILPTEVIGIPTLEALKVTDLNLTDQAEITESGIINRKIHVSYKIPINTNWSYCQVYYKISGDTSWAYSGNSDVNYYNITNVEQNTLYDVKVVSVNRYETRQSFSEAPTSQIITTKNADFTDINLQVRVSGLQIYNQANNTDFVGKDCKFIWHDLAAVRMDYQEADDEVQGAATYIPNTWLKDYEIKIYDNTGNLRRTEYIVENYYIYSHEKNYEDGNGNAVRNFEIQVRARDKYYRVSQVAAKLTVNNEAPPVPGNIVIQSLNNKSYQVYWDEVNAIDKDYYIVYASQTSGFTPAVNNIVYKGKDTQCSISIVLKPKGYWYAKVVCVDSFGEDELNYSNEYTFSDITPPISPEGFDAAAAVKKIICSWDANPEIDLAGYEIYMSITPDFTPDIVTHTDRVYRTALIIKTLAEITGNSDTVYYLRIRAYDLSENYSEFSGQISTKTGIITNADIQANSVAADQISTGTLSAITADCGDLTAGTIKGINITGGTFQTALPGENRVQIDHDGIKFLTSNPPDAWGDGGIWGDGGLWGDGLVARLNLANFPPLYINALQPIADIHLYNRGNIPAGKAETGDICVINGKLSICINNGTPGIWETTCVGRELSRDELNPSEFP